MKTAFNVSGRILMVLAVLIFITLLIIYSPMELLVGIIAGFLLTAACYIIFHSYINKYHYKQLIACIKNGQTGMSCRFRNGDNILEGEIVWYNEDSDTVKIKYNKDTYYIVDLEQLLPA